MMLCFNLLVLQMFDMLIGSLTYPSTLHFHSTISKPADSTNLLCSRRHDAILCYFDMPRHSITTKPFHPPPLPSLPAKRKQKWYRRTNTPSSASKLQYLGDMTCEQKDLNQQNKIDQISQ